MSATDLPVFWHDQMRLAFGLAKKGPLVNENPRVGCVITTEDGVVVADGFHRGAGSPHAEVEALEALAQKGMSASGLTAVVTLEPCRHQGRTGPCVKALIEAGIGRVVYSVSDPGGQSAGGADILRQAGVQVIAGVLADEGLDIVRHWHTATRLDRPFVTVKWAQSLDGRIAAADGSSQWITSPETRARIHLDRSEHGGIIVGTETALVDNPSLTARDQSGDLLPAQPHAVVIGKRDLPVSHRVHSHPAGFSHFKTHDISTVLDTLYARGIRSVYVEGGATLIAAFITAGKVDEFHITIGPMLLGGPQAAITDIGVSTLSEALGLTLTDFYVTGGDIRIVARPTPSPTTEEAPCLPD